MQGHCHINSTSVTPPHWSPLSLQVGVGWDVSARQTGAQDAFSEALSVPEMFWAQPVPGKSDPAWLFMELLAPELERWSYQHTFLTNRPTWGLPSTHERTWISGSLQDCKEVFQAPCLVFFTRPCYLLILPHTLNIFSNSSYNSH